MNPPYINATFLLALDVVLSTKALHIIIEVLLPKRFNPALAKRDVRAAWFVIHFLYFWAVIGMWYRRDNNIT